MNIAIVGTGYVGLVTGACFAEMGIDVTCVDIDRAKIERIERGDLPIYEPGLEELVAKNVREGRLHFTTDLAACLDRMEVVFSAVGTPPDDDGSADLRYVREVARTFGQHLKKYTVLVTKSTVPVGTSLEIKQIIQKELDKRGVDVAFDVASNPEFLKEGAAIKDFMSPDRVVVGVESEAAKTLIEKLYKPFLLNGYRLYFMDIPSAEMTKYASNAMLATRISFMNDIANLCEMIGADVDQVRRGMGADPRIGAKFLYSGCGYGGSCFPKDVRALASSGRKAGYPMRIVEAVDEVNNDQKIRVFHKLQQAFGGDLRGKTIALWGVSFKPETDDMREAPSLVVVDRILRNGGNVRVFDPEAMDEARRRFGDSVRYAVDMYDAVSQVDALVLLTEWKQFRLPDWAAIRKAMRGDVLIDGRNIYDPAEMQEHGFRYDRIGKKMVNH